MMEQSAQKQKNIGKRTKIVNRVKKKKKESAMTLKHYLAGLAFLAYCSCSYTEIINNTTSNAAAAGLNWTMTNVIPSVTGLTIDGVIYQYTAVKNIADPMTVSIQNKNALGTGYIFRSVDDWTGLRGNSITKVVPVNNIPSAYWGNGEIAVEGKGQVQNPLVFYKYRYDTCVNDPTSSPSCPGYAAAMAKYAAQPVDTSSEYVKAALVSPPPPVEEQKVPSPEPKDKRNDKLANEKKTIVNSLVGKEAAQTAAKLEMMNNIPGLDLYRINIPGGAYNETIKYADKKLPDSSRARSLGMAQEKLHREMVDSQFIR
jgi:hypothetical protein